MVDYRRVRIPGGTYFFTVALADRSSTLLVDEAERLRNVIREVQSRRPFESVAMVVMPEHLHSIWTLPDGDSDYSGRWRAIKAAFVRSLDRSGFAIPRRGRECVLWQRRFWEHAIRDEDDLARHVDYIHHNPVKHGHTKRAIDWPFSSIHRHARQRRLPPDRACEADTFAGWEP